MLQTQSLYWGQAVSTLIVLSTMWFVCFWTSGVSSNPNFASKTISSTKSWHLSSANVPLHFTLPALHLQQKSRWCEHMSNGSFKHLHFFFQLMRKSFLCFSYLKKYLSQWVSRVYADSRSTNWCNKNSRVPHLSAHLLSLSFYQQVSVAKKISKVTELQTTFSVMMHK